MNPFKNEIEQLLKLGLSLNGFTLDKDGNRVDAQTANREYLKALAGADSDPKVIAQLYQDAWNDKTGEKMRALNALRVEQVSNFVSAMSTIGSMFFEQATLGPDEAPAYTNDTGNEVSVGYVAEDGSVDTVKVAVDQDATKIPLRLLQTPKVRYKTMDLYKGNVANVTKKTLDLARDMANQVDSTLFTLLTASLANGGCFGPFGYETANGNVISGNKNRATRVFLTTSNIRAEHLPGTNDLDLTQTAGGTATVQGVANVIRNPGAVVTSKFGLEVILETLRYQNLWGKYLPEGGSLMATGDIIVPSKDIMALAETNVPTINVSAQRIQESLNESGYMAVHYLGKDWRFVPDATIASGTCYPQFNMKPGKVWFKPVWDREFVTTNEEENWESRSVRKAIGATIISQHRPRALRIKYA